MLARGMPFQRMTSAHRLAVLLLCLAAGMAAGTLQGADVLTVGYFPQWGVYDRHYTIKDLESSGAADHLDVLCYAFTAIGPDGLVALTDAHADIDQSYSAATSVDGVADAPGPGILRGSFNQLRKLKLKHPRLRVVISIGGWTLSDRFSDMAMDEARRTAFVTSCITTVIVGHIAPGIDCAGLIDGLDIDWEYPASAGASGHFRPEDTRTYTALLAELRRQLDARAATDHRRYTLSAALPVSAAVYGRIELGRIHQSLDYLHLMAYDVHGGWEQMTAPLAALSRSPRDPAGEGQATIEHVISDYRAAGVPANKLILGVPFYGRGWAGVAPGPQGDGLYQPASGPARGSAAPGIDDDRILMAQSGATAYRDPASSAFWTYNLTTHVLWSFDDATAVRAKRQFVLANGLGGLMCWDLSGDDARGTLMRALSTDPVRSGTP